MVKFYPPMIKQDFTSEIEVRAALKTAGAGVPFPPVVAAGVFHDRIEWAYIIEAFCPGQPARDLWRDMQVRDRECVASQVADILRLVHSTPLSLVPTLEVTAAEWRRLNLERLETCVEEIAVVEVLPGVRLPESRTSGSSWRLRESAS